jgi:hypothetical protein
MATKHVSDAYFTTMSKLALVAVVAIVAVIVMGIVAKSLV